MSNGKFLSRAMFDIPVRLPADLTHRLCHFYEHLPEWNDFPPCDLVKVAISEYLERHPDGPDQEVTEDD